MESTSAFHDASMMFSLTPTVPQLPRLSLVVMMTRVVALVPAPSSSKIRTL